MWKFMAIVAILGFGGFAFGGEPESRYAVIGDSYSSGEGATPEQSWPSLLAAHLRESGAPVKLVANPSRTGWTSQQALDDEMPVFKNAKPDFATLQIGVNDWVQGVPAAQFRKNLVLLMDRMLALLSDKKKLLVVNIPDFSVTPSGASFGNPAENARGISAFNKIIGEETAARGLALVDVFAVSRKMRDDPALIAPDGLHPSAKEYGEWEKLIFPVARGLLAGQTPAR
jgi:lysophospholipase L1-like esterase